METLRQDVRYGLRSLRKSPGFTCVAALTLALGIGANAVMLSLVRGLLWRPPAVSHPQELVIVFARNQADGAFVDFSHADYEDFRRADGPFAGLAGYYPLPLGLSYGGTSERSWGEMVSGNYFEVLRVEAALGRTLTAEDDRAGAARSAVISHRLWTARFGSDPGVVGREVRVGGQPFTVVGVAPRGFSGVYFTGFQPALWVPAHAVDGLPGAGVRLADRGTNGFRAIGRLRAGATVEQAQAALGAVAARLSKEHPRTNAGLLAAVLPERDSRPEPETAANSSRMASVFLAGVGLVLLIACANVANLLFARGSARAGEVAVRLALGAERRRLLRQLLTESLLLSGIGGAIGLLGALWAARALSAGLRLPTEIPFAFDVRLDLASVLVSAGACVVAAVASGLAPALQALRADVLRPLHGGSGSVRATGRGRLGGALVIGQVGMSCLLLIAAGLAFRSLNALHAVDPGFDARHGLLVSIAPGLQGYDEARGAALYRRVQDAVASVPGVRAAALARFVPLEFAASGGALHVEGAPARPEPGAEMTGWSAVTPGYFQAMGTLLREGRDFDWRDDAKARGVVVVNETLAARYWPGRTPIGQKLRLNTPDAPPLEVVGVVKDGKYRRLSEGKQPYLFLPLGQAYRDEATIVVRTAGDPRTLVASVREAVRSVDPELPTYDVKTLEQLVAGRSLLGPRLAAGLAVAFAGVAVLLALVGLYGIVSYGVTRRVREIGIRMALGATRARIVAAVVADGARLALWGVGLGLLGAAAGTRVLSSILYGVSATDAATFAGVPLLLLAAAGLAAFVPARRAASADPLSSLRSE